MEKLLIIHFPNEDPMKKKTAFSHAAVLLLLASFLAGQARADTSQIGMAIRSAREIAKINRDNRQDFNDFMEGQLTQMAIANANSSRVVPTARLAQWLTDLLVSDMSPSNRQAFAERRVALVTWRVRRKTGHLPGHFCRFSRRWRQVLQKSPDLGGKFSPPSRPLSLDIDHPSADT